MTRRPPPRVNGNRLTAMENAVLDLWDEGLGSKAIARRLDLAERRVIAIVGTFNGGTSEQTTAENNIKAGSAALLAALQGAV